VQHDRAFGDALSHVDVAHEFSGSAKRRPTNVTPLESGPMRHPTIRASAASKSVPAGICMAAMRRHRGTIWARSLHLTITCLNLFVSKEDCIRM
jgi:hypothetical protein